MGMAIWSATEQRDAVVPRALLRRVLRQAWLPERRSPPGVAGRERRLARVRAQADRAVPALHPPQFAGDRREAQCQRCARAHRARAERSASTMCSSPVTATRRCASSRTRRAAEQEILGAFPYQENAAVLHTDARLLPRTPLARAAWNYHLLGRPRQSRARPRRAHLRHERAAVARRPGEIPGHAQPHRGHRPGDDHPQLQLLSSGLSTGRRGRAEAARRGQRRQSHVLLRRLLALRLPRRRRGQRRVGARGLRAHHAPRGPALHAASERLARAV